MAVSLIGSIALSVLALYFAFKNVPFADLFKYLVSINYFWVLPAVLITLFSFVLRALRWRIILASTKKLSIMRAFHPMMIGFMINCVLPGRLGEVARPLILQKKDPGGISQCRFSQYLPGKWYGPYGNLSSLARRYLPSVV